LEIRSKGPRNLSKKSAGKKNAPKERVAEKYGAVGKRGVVPNPGVPSQEGLKKGRKNRGGKALEKKDVRSTGGGERE